MWQVDTLTPRCVIFFLFFFLQPLPCQGWAKCKSRKTPSPPCYITIATNHTGTQCTLCSSAAKYKTTGRDAVCITRDCCSLFHVEFGLISRWKKKSVINHSYLTKYRWHACITRPSWQWDCAARWFHLFFRTDSKELYSHVAVLEVPQSSTKEVQTKHQPNCKICHYTLCLWGILTLFLTVIPIVLK